MRLPSRPCWPRSRGGFTLPEIIVASAIMLAVTFASSGLLSAGLRSQASQQTQADLQRDAAGVLSRLADELSESDPACVRVDTSPSGIVFATPRDDLGRFSYDSTGSVLWRGYACYYVDRVNGVRGVVRKCAPLASPATTPPAVPLTMTTAWFALQPLPCRMVGARVSDLTITGFNPMLVSIAARQTADDVLTLTTRVCLRN